MSYTAADYLSADISITDIVKIYHTSTENWSRPDRRERECEGLLFFISGDNYYEFGDITFEARAGQVVRLPSGVPYNGDRISGDRLEFYCIDFVSPADSYLRFPLPLAFTPSDPKRFIRQFEEILTEYRGANMCSRINVKAMVLQLLSRLAMDYAANTLHYDNRSRILQIREYIRQMAHRPDFRISDAASHFHISAAHLRRLFASELGISPSDFLAEERIERAKQLLLDPRALSICEVADACGYTSLYYFSSMFRERVGASPSDWRKTGGLLL